MLSKERWTRVLRTICTRCSAFKIVPSHYSLAQSKLYFQTVNVTAKYLPRINEALERTSQIMTVPPMAMPDFCTGKLFSLPAREPWRIQCEISGRGDLDPFCQSYTIHRPDEFCPLTLAKLPIYTWSLRNLGVAAVTRSFDDGDEIQRVFTVNRCQVEMSGATGEVALEPPKEEESGLNLCHLFVREGRLFMHGDKWVRERR